MSPYRLKSSCSSRCRPYCMSDPLEIFLIRWRRNRKDEERPLSSDESNHTHNSPLFIYKVVSIISCTPTSPPIGASPSFARWAKSHGPMLGTYPRYSQKGPTNIYQLLITLNEELVNPHALRSTGQFSLRACCSRVARDRGTVGLRIRNRGGKMRKNVRSVQISS
jgi:hypothetical protein